MPFYTKGNGELKPLLGEKILSRKPSGTKIAKLAVKADDRDKVSVKTLDGASVIVRYGSGFKEVAVDEVVVEKGDLIIHDQKTNDMVVIIFSDHAITTVEQIQ